MGELRITQRRSVAGTTPKHRDTLRTLGLGKIGASTHRADGPAIQGALRLVARLVQVEKV